jgi:hypothetical protein
MGRKTKDECASDARQAERDTAAREGKCFAVPLTIGGNHRGISFFSTAPAAEAERDALFRRLDKSTPADFYERKAHAILFEVAIEGFDGRRWLHLRDSERRGNYGTIYPDER